MMIETPSDYLLKIKSTTILIEVASKEGVYISKLKRITDSAFDSLFIFINELEEAGLLTSEKKGRVRLLNATEKGKEVANTLVHLKCI